MKFCSTCGFQNADSAVYCARCGSSVSGSANAGGPTVVVVGSNQPQAPAGSNPGTVWLVLNIIVTALACCFNVLGIIGIIFGAMSVSKFNKGLYADAKSNANVSKWMFIIGIILGVLGIIISILAGLVPTIIALISTVTNAGY